jgi:hypothetical protein
MDFGALARLVALTYTSFLVNPLFWLVAILVGSQYRRVTRVEEKFFGRAKSTFLRPTMLSAAAGLAGGLLASMLLVFSGISLVDIGIQFVWPLALLLLLVSPRYLCFAYAGGLVGVLSILTSLAGRLWSGLLDAPLLGILAGLHIPGLLALIAILHLTESFLIAVTGHLHPSPLYLKTESGRVVGGFSLQKFWPLPLVGLVTSIVPEALVQAAESVKMPDWWPLFQSTAAAGPGQALMYMVFPVVAGLGYGELAVSTPPRQKSIASARTLAAYSLVLLALALLALRLPSLTVFAALFAPFGHELLIIAANKKEFAGNPLYVAPPRGVRILDVYPGSAAEAAGLVPGDTVLAMDGLPVDNQYLFYSLLAGGGGSRLVVERGDKTLHVRLAARRGDSAYPGTILVPQEGTGAFMEVKHIHFISALREKLRTLRKRLKN